MPYINPTHASLSGQPHSPPLQLHEDQGTTAHLTIQRFDLIEKLAQALNLCFCGIDRPPKVTHEAASGATSFVYKIRAFQFISFPRLDYAIVHPR
jgi:hypothetical protein